MNFNAITIITTILFSAVLTFGGGYIAIDNLLHPAGNLFEGTVLFSLGILGFMLIAVASAVGKAILNFRQIYVKQLEMQQEMVDFYNQAMQQQRPKSIGEILGGIDFGKTKDQNSITITNLETGETSTSPLGDINTGEFLKNFLTNMAAARKAGEKDPEDKTLEELERDLAKAVKDDQYELAKKIRDEIRRRKGEN